MKKNSINGMRTAAIIPAKGIGDGLLMLIASHQLESAGIKTTTIHPALPELASWFPGKTLLPKLSIDELRTYDLVIVENDNSEKVRSYAEQIPQLSIFYPSYAPPKHRPLTAFDQVFDCHLPMAENISRAIAQLLNIPMLSKENGLKPPSLIEQKPQQIIIHPTSSEKKKNWRPEQFIKLAGKLQRAGYCPVFALSLTERDAWLEQLNGRFPVPELTVLSDLAELIAESQLVIGNDSLAGHLASNLSVPYLVIADNAKRLQLWKPGWGPGKVLTPWNSIPNLKPFRLREKHWQMFISPSRAYRSALALLQ